MKPTPARIALQINPSFRLGCFILATHLAAIGMVLWLTIEQPLWMVLALPVLYSGARSWRLHMQRHWRLEWDGEGNWRLFDIGGQAQEVQLLGDSRVWAGLIILNFRQVNGGRRRSLILLSDNSDAEQRRRLRVRLLTVNW